MTRPTQKIAYLQARWHADIVDQALSGFRARLDETAPGAVEIETFDVPGAFELPLLAKKLAARGDIDAVVACAFVVDGGIYRHEFVAETVVGALMDAQMATGTPVFSVVLTPHHFHEIADHETFFGTHFVKKGAEAADAVLLTLATHQAAEAA